MSDVVAPVKAIIKAIDTGIKLAHRVSESASSASTAKALQISESAPSLQQSLERTSQAIRDAYSQNVEACGEPFTKALAEDKTIQTKLKDLKNEVRDGIDECQDFEDEPESFDPAAFLNIQRQAYKCSADCISIFKGLRDQLGQASLQRSGSDQPLDDRVQLTSMRQHRESSQSNSVSLSSYISPPTPTEPLRILTPSLHAPPSEPVKPKSHWGIDSTLQFDMGPTLSGSIGTSLRRKPIRDISPTAQESGPRLIPKEVVHSRISANEEFLERRRQSRLLFNELRYSVVSSISENRVSEVFSDGPLSPFVTSPASPGTSTSPAEGRGFRGSLNGYDMHMTRQRSQGQASQGTRSSRTSSILPEPQSVNRHDSEDSIFGLRAAPASPPLVEAHAAGASGNIELWSPIATTASPVIIENPQTWDPMATTAISENRATWGPISATLQVPGFGSGVVAGLEPVSNLDYDDEKMPVDVPQESFTQSTPTFSVSAMDYPIRPDSSFSKFGGFCEGAKALIRGETGFKIVKRPAGHYSATVSARCISCSYEVGWNDVEKDRLLDKSGIYGNSGIRWRQRFISKCHLKTNSIETPKYACIFCIEVHRTVEEHDATIFFSVGQLFRHIAKHPQPVPNVNGVTVLYGLQDRNVIDFDIHFTSSQPLVPEFPYAAIAQKVASRPSGQANVSNHPKNERSDSRDPDGNPVLHFAVGARIIGLTFPDRFHGVWCIGYHDGLRGAFPATTITLDLPGRDDEVMNMNSNLVAFAKWDFKLKNAKEGRWLKFAKGETITHIGFKYQDQWCWTGQNAKGQWGLFPNAFVDNLHDGGLFSTSPGSVKKGSLTSRMASFPLGRHRSSNKHERKTSFKSTSSGGSGNSSVQLQPGLEVVQSPMQPPSPPGSSRFHFSSSHGR